MMDYINISVGKYMVIPQWQMDVAGSRYSGLQLEV